MKNRSVSKSKKRSGDENTNKDKRPFLGRQVTMETGDAVAPAMDTMGELEEFNAPDQRPFFGRQVTMGEQASIPQQEGPTDPVVTDGENDDGSVDNTSIQSLMVGNNDSYRGDGVERVSGSQETDLDIDKDEIQDLKIEEEITSIIERYVARRVVSLIKSTFDYQNIGEYNERIKDIFITILFGTLELRGIRYSIGDVIKNTFNNILKGDDKSQHISSIDRLNIADKYVSYLYNPLELLAIQTILYHLKMLKMLDLLNPRLIIEEITERIHLEFDYIIEPYCRIISYQRDYTSVNEKFNLLYNELNSIRTVCDVVFENNTDLLKNHLMYNLQYQWNYVLSYLSTIPALLYIKFDELIQATPNHTKQLKILQDFNINYKGIILGDTDFKKLGYGQELSIRYLESVSDDIHRINEISDVTFTQLLDSYNVSKEQYAKELYPAFIEAREYPKIISDYGEDPPPDDYPLFTTPETITFNRDLIQYEYVFTEVEGKGEEGKGEEGKGEEGKEDMSIQIGGMGPGTFDDFIQVLGTMHDIIIKTYTLPGDPTSIMSIKDDFVDYSDGDFSGKKIVLDFLGMFMGLVIHYLKPSTDGKITSHFTYNKVENEKTPYIQSFGGGDVIMAGYSTSQLYKDGRGGKNPTLKPLIADSDIMRNIELYSFNDIEVNKTVNVVGDTTTNTKDKTTNAKKRVIINKTYAELFQIFPSINSTENGIFEGWISDEQPSSLTPFINLALTLDGTQLENRGSKQKFVTLTKEKPIKSFQSCFGIDTYDLSYPVVSAKVNGMMDSSYGIHINEMTATFLNLRRELITLLVEQGEGVLRYTTGTSLMAMDPNFKLSLKNPDIDTFFYNYIYAYVYKNIISGNSGPLYSSKCMSLISSIMMTKIGESISKNPSKDHGWSKLLNDEICKAYGVYTSQTNIVGDMSRENSPIGGSTEEQWAMGGVVRTFNDDHYNLFKSFYYNPQLVEENTTSSPPTLKGGVFYINYRDGTKSYGIQVNGILPQNITGKLSPFLEKYAVDTCFDPCFTSRPTSSEGELNSDGNVYENNCVSPPNINACEMLYKIFAMDECHDTKPGKRTSLAVSEYIIKIADRSFKMIDPDLEYKSIIEESRKIDPKNPEMRSVRSWEVACSKKITGGETHNARVGNFGYFTKINKNTLGISPVKAGKIRGATTTANTYNNAVFFGNENSGNSGTFVDGGTKKTLQNIHLPNLCINIIDKNVRLGDKELYNANFIVIVSYGLIVVEGQLQLRMYVSLIYIKYRVLSPTSIGPPTNLFVTHEFILGKGISCAQIYDDIFTGLKYNNEFGPNLSGDNARNKLTDPMYDALLAVLVVLKKTLCDWLQNFLKINVHTKLHRELGFSVEIQPKINIQDGLLSYPTDKAVADFSKSGISYTESITGIDKVLLALERAELFNYPSETGFNPVYYICIRPEPSSGFLFVPYSPTTKLFSFKTNPNPFILINSEPYIPKPNEDTSLSCYVPRFHLFNYINIFWDKYRSVYSPENYRAISTLPSLTPNGIWKPDFCITLDILDLWISFTLTKITFWPLPPQVENNQIEYVSSKITPSTPIVIIDDKFTELKSPVDLTKLSMLGGFAKINTNNRRKRRVSYSTTKRRLKRGFSKKKTKRSNQKKTKMKKTEKKCKQNKMKSKRTNKNITYNNKKR